MSIRRTGALLALLVLVVTACSPGPGTGGQLEGTKWVLNSLDVDGSLTIAPETVYADARFDSRRVSGFSGCNQFDALYQAGGRTLLVSQPASTLMACDEATMAFEAQFLALLQASRFYTVQRDTLTVFGAVGEGALLVFDAAPRNPLLGKWTVDSYGVPPSSVVAVLPDTEIDVVFGIGTVGGFAGCNSFSGTYGTNGTVVRISRLATTRLACDDAVMEQETAFLEALQGAALVEPRGATLNLTDRQGGIAVALARPMPPEPDASASPTPSPTPEATATPTPTAAPDGHTDADPNADCEADAQADANAGTHEDARADGGTHGGSTHDGPTDGLVQAGRSRGSDRRHDRLSRDLVHGDRARRAGVPVLRCRADHGAGRPGDPRHAGSGGHPRDAVPGGRDRGDGRGQLESGHQVGVQRPRGGGDLHRRDRRDRCGRHPGRPGEICLSCQRADGGDRDHLGHGRAGR